MPSLPSLRGRSPGNAPRAVAPCAQTAVLGLALAMGGALACADAPTRPTGSAAPLVAPEALGQVHAVLGDASGRLVQTSAMLVLRAALTDHLTRLGDAIDRGDAGAATRALGAARVELARLAALPEAADGDAERASIALALDAVEQRIAAGSSPMGEAVAP